MTNPKLSIIVPCYNVEQFLIENFQSLIDQDLKLGDEYEIIYIDDKSTDQTWRILETLSQEGVRIYHNESNVGVSRTRNFGIELARGDLLWFVDGDDFIEPKILCKLLDKYHASSDVVGVNIHAASVSLYSSPRFINRTNSWGFNYNACNYIISKEYLLKNDIKFPANINSGEDQLFVFQARFFGGEFAETNSIIYYYRMNPSSLTHSSSHEKHLANMEAMLSFYHQFKEGNKGKGTKNTNDNLLERIQWTSANICADAVYLSKDRANKILEKLKANGDYPFPILWKRLTFKYGIKVWLINFLRLPLCYTWYFKCLNRLLNK